MGAAWEIRLTPKPAGFFAFPETVSFLAESGFFTIFYASLYKL